ncbi:hypothetical protein GUJ93_ZPchr0458g22537, partial [Zizania palustris]
MFAPQPFIFFLRSSEIAEFFRQFGPLEKVEHVRGHDDPERHLGFLLPLPRGDDAEASAERAVEVDGLDFRWRSFTVRLDDGRKGKARAEQRARWVYEGRRREPRSPWHECKDEGCREFRRMVESRRPGNCLAVASAFERIPKGKILKHGSCRK